MQLTLSKCLKIYQLFLGCLVTSEQKLFNYLIRKAKTTYNSDGGLNHVISPPMTPLAKQIRQHYNFGIEGDSIRGHLKIEKFESKYENLKHIYY